MKKTPKNLLAVADELSASLANMRFAGAVTHVYNPLEYAREVFAEYACRYGSAAKETVLVGMNPGPWGMAQTGVPFGEVSMVRDWMKIAGTIGKPPREHPARRVLGFECPRSEVSGRRLWGWAQEQFGTPQRFFQRFYVANYCPLLFMESSGRNLTPDKLSATERAALEAACDSALRKTIGFLKPRFVIGVGNYAEKCATRSLAGMDLTIGRILHPSPASPAANKDWAAQVARQMKNLGLVF
jgi:single-strand selective monofunctional uracil DNA glycosylase